MLFRMQLAEYGVEYFEHRTGLPIIGILIVIGILLNVLLTKMAYNKLLGASLTVIILFAILA